MHFAADMEEMTGRWIVVIMASYLKRYFATRLFDRL